MKLFSNQGQHLSSTKQAKKTTPSIKLVSKKSSTPKKPPTSPTLSKEDIRKLFDEPMETAYPIEAELSAPVEEELPAPMDEELPAPAEEELPAPAEEDLPAPAEEELPTPVEEEQDVPVLLEQATIVIDSISMESIQKTDVLADSIEQAFAAENSTISSPATPKKQPLIFAGYAVILVVLLAVLCGITAFFVNALKETLALQKDLLENDTVAVSTSPAPTDDPLTTIQPVESTPEPTTTPEAPPTVLPQYAEDAEKNPDMFGWICIDGTKIDYPVMHTPDDPEKYLYKSFNGWPTASGSLFIDAKCSPDSDNLIIYGHNIKNGTMFNSILKYESIDYFNEHPIVKFDTIYKEQEYEVMSAFYDRVYYKSETDVFKFYQFIDAEDEEHFNSAVQTLKDKSIYDTGVTAEYGDQLIMLVTCAYHTENGRFVVVARKSA